MPQAIMMRVPITMHRIIMMRATGIIWRRMPTVVMRPLLIPANGYSGSRGGRIPLICLRRFGGLTSQEINILKLE